MTFCNTGSEAVVAAVRVARTITARNKIVIFTGAYHGMFDEVVVKGVKTATGLRSIPVAPGIPREMVENIVVLDYGSSEALDYIASHGNELAAVMVEPVQSRHPALQPIEFLKQVRQITERTGTALIFDEVVTGFRVHQGGCQALFGIKADLATYGKVIGGGLPIGVLAGRAAFMDALDGGMWQFGDQSYPETGVTFFAGTFVRHPLALAATMAVLNYLKEQGPSLQAGLAAKTTRMAEELNGFLAERLLPVRIDTFGSIANFTFPAEFKFASMFYVCMRERGIHIQEGFPMFLTTAHTDEDLAQVVTAFKESILEMQAAEFLPATPSSYAPAASNGAKPKPLLNGAEAAPLAPSGIDHDPIAARPALNGSASAASHVRRAPMTESQIEIWLSAKMSDEASCCYNESFTLKLKGALNTSALFRAIDQVIARHEALRATFSADGGYQEFTPEVRLNIPVEDLSQLDAATRQARLNAIIDVDARLPFDLDTGPLVRAKLIKLGPTEHHLIFTSHHIVCDGWSTNVILDELSKLYSAACQGRLCELRAPMAFSAHSHTQAEHFRSVEGSAIESYWIEQFKQPPPLLDLPLDRPRQPVRSYQGATCRRRISADTYRNLKKASAQQKCTLFVTLLAALQVLLGRLSGQDDVVIGIPAAGQSLLGDEILVGHCVNFLPLRGRIETDPTIAEYLGQVKRTVLDAYEHQNYTYGRLIRKLRIERDPSRLPLTEVQFNLERVGGAMKFAELEVEVDPNPKSFVNQDLFLNLVESENGLTLDCDYNTGLFDQETIDRWLGHYETLLEGIIANASKPVSRLPLLSAEERHRMLIEWNDTYADYPRDMTVHKLLEIQAARTPDAVAVTYEDQELTYRDLDHRATRLANHLAALGVEPGVRVGVFVERSLEMLVALLGVLKAGGAYVPMDPTYPKERISYVLEDARVPILLTQQRFAQTLPASAARMVLLDADQELIEKGSATASRSPAMSSDELAYVIYTSGSTGNPKGVEIAQAMIRRGAGGRRQSRRARAVRGLAGARGRPDRARAVHTRRAIGRRQPLPAGADHPSGRRHGGRPGGPLRGPGRAHREPRWQRRRRAAGGARRQPARAC